MRLRHTLARAATVLLALPFAFAIAASAPAQAEEVEVPGCYGVSVVVCDPAVEFVLPAGTRPWSTTIPVCAGTCQEVPVNAVTAELHEDPYVCIKTEDRNGNESRTCRPIGVTPLPPVGVPTVELCDNGQTGVVIYNEDGSTLFRRCANTDVLPTWYVGECSYYGESGYYVYDENGNTVVNGCFTTPGRPRVTVCKSPYIGVVIYDTDGNQVTDCMILQDDLLPNLYEICRSLAISDAWSINCSIFRLDFIQT